jgi:hypothetical protein
VQGDRVRWSSSRVAGLAPASAGVETTAHTIFFGGGTPSLLSPPQFASIFKSIRSAFTLTSDPEITIEANPGTVSYENLLKLREIGINRISYGVQSANAFELRMLERAHNFFDVIEAVTSARKAGFDNLNLDLIYGSARTDSANLANHRQRILDLPRTYLRLRADPRTRHSLWTLGIEGTAPPPRPRPRRGNVRMAGKRSKRMGTSIMRSAIGQSRTANANTTCNTGADFPTSPSAPALMDTRMATATPMSCASKPTSNDLPIPQSTNLPIPPLPRDCQPPQTDPQR